MKFLKNVFTKELNMIFASFSAKISSHNSKLRPYSKSFNEFL
jgi:hypothetical protein